MTFLLAYFRTSEEALHLAWSEDGLQWEALNGNLPVLHADVGNRSVRDPFLRYCADGWFHLLSTDSWSSPNILHARSRDLINWEPWDVTPIMQDVPGIRNTWAPEFYYDPKRQTYVVFWSSITATAQHQRIWYAETKDFRAYTAPAILFDPGYSVIDATLVLHNAIYYLIYKDERGENYVGTDYKAMRVATASHTLGPYTAQTDLITPSLTEGPAVFFGNDRWLMLYDSFLGGHWGASSSNDLLHWDALDSVVVPADARHGSVVSLSAEHWQRLQTLI